MLCFFMSTKGMCLRSLHLISNSVNPCQGNYVLSLPSVQAETPVVSKEAHWAETVDVSILNSLPESEITRQG